MWETLRRLRGVSEMPWLVVGDFNEVMWSFEYFSECERAEGQMAAFRDALGDCDLMDLGFSGLPFTYDNGREQQANVKVRLDRAVADTGWRDLFPEAAVSHLVSSCSDHCPLFLEIKKESWECHKPRIFRYEIMWERLESLAEEVKVAWCSAPDREGLGGIAVALKHVQSALRVWSKENFGSVSTELNALRVRLEELKGSPATSRRDLREVTDRMDELLYKEEMMWLQRSGIAWLREGDKNTSYFHRQVVWRARKNRIKKLKGADGGWYENPGEMKELVADFFRNLYSQDPAVALDQLLQLVDMKVDAEMNDQPCREFSTQEISDALFQMGTLKAPGPDGFPARFFQRRWEILRDDVVRAVQRFFAEGVMPPGINDTAIVLIPKGNNPTELKDLRPIFLCNVIYKVISKCMVNSGHYWAI